MSDVGIWMPLYVSDWLSSTRRLSLDEKGAAMDLLCELWQNDGSIPFKDEQLARLLGCTVEQWRGIWFGIKGLFEIEDGNLTQTRLVRELNASVERRGKAVERAKKAALARHHASSTASSTASSNQQAVLEQCPPSSSSPSHAPSASQPQEATPRAKRSEGDADLALADTMRASVKDPAPTWTDKVWQRERERYAKAIRLARESDGRSPEMLATLCARWGELPQQARAWAETHPMDWKRDVAKNHALLPGKGAPVQPPRPTRVSLVIPPGFMEIEGQLVRAPAPRVAR